MMKLGPMQLSHNLRNVISAVFEGPTNQKTRKTQGLLKAMLQVMFPNQGEKIRCVYSCLYVHRNATGL